MLIGVLSDTHDHLPQIDAAVELFTRRGVEAVLHVGDFIAPFAVMRLQRFAGPIHAVFGNNDGERRMLKEVMPQVQDGPQLLELGGRRILLHHFVEWCPADLIAQADVIVTGHTHEPVNRIEPASRVDKGKLVLNPGECCGWLSDRSTVALLDTAGPKAKIMELELR